MDPEQYNASEWKELAKQLTARQLRGALKSAYRKEAKKAVAIARAKLRASGLSVKGNRGDWEKGVRSFIYSKGGGFLVTVKGRAGNGRKKELSMHENRRYPVTRRRLPILMWADTGTRQRYSGPGERGYEWGRTKRISTRRGIVYKIRRRQVRTSGINRGRMPAYRFLDKASPAMYKSVEAGLLPEVEKAVRRTAAKAGF